MVSESSDSAIGRLCEYIQDWAAAFACSKSIATPHYRLPHDFAHDEAASFLNGLDAGIISVDSIGRFSLPFLFRFGTKPTEPCLFSVHEPNMVYLAWREYITQVASAAALILEYGCPANSVALDPRDWVFDLAVFPKPERDSPMLLAGETKKSHKELKTTLEVLLDASKRRLPLFELTKADGHKKYAGLLREQPTYFWAVAPGVRRAFQVHYEAKRAVLVEINDLPRPFWSESQALLRNS